MANSHNNQDFYVLVVSHHSSPRALNSKNLMQSCSFTQYVSMYISLEYKSFLYITFISIVIIIYSSLWDILLFWFFWGAHHPAHKINHTRRFILRNAWLAQFVEHGTFNSRVMDIQAPHWAPKCCLQNVELFQHHVCLHTTMLPVIMVCWSVQKVWQRWALD